MLGPDYPGRSEDHLLKSLESSCKEEEKTTKQI